MSVSTSRLIRILGYLILFCVSLLVFDAFTMMIGVFTAMFALYFFSARAAERDRMK